VSNPELEKLIEQCYPQIRRAALVMSGRAWEADDLAQETFLQAIQGWSRFAGDSRVETWLYGILMRVQSKRKRSAGRAWNRWISWFQGQPAVVLDSVKQGLELQEWQESLWPAVARLPLVQQQVLILRYSEDLSLVEISEILGCPAGTVKSRLHHGLLALQKLLNGHGGPAFETAVCSTQKTHCRNDEESHA
jgi:RNA polymerase sigma-70 factor (ECF subfamily)